MPFSFLFERLLPWLRRRRAERDIRRELDLHLELETRQNLERGMSPAEAARASRAALGNVPLIREDVRAVWKWRWLDQLVQDVRCGARALTRGPGFAALSIATLALAIGATTAIFSVVYGILLRPLPVAEPDRLVRIVNIGYVGELLELRGRARTLQVSAHLPPGDRTLTGFDRPLRLSVVPVAGDLLARLGRPPALGPGFRLDDERPGAAPAAILSHVLWRQRFGSDRTVVGRTLLLDGSRTHGARGHAAGLRVPVRRRRSLGADDRGCDDPGRPVGAQRVPDRPTPARCHAGERSRGDPGTRRAVRPVVPLADARCLRNACQPADVAG